MNGEEFRKFDREFNLSHVLASINRAKYRLSAQVEFDKEEEIYSAHLKNALRLLEICSSDINMEL